jgi:hypothetical protein
MFQFVLIAAFVAMVTAFGMGTTSCEPNLTFDEYETGGRMTSADCSADPCVFEFTVVNNGTSSSGATEAEVEHYLCNGSYTLTGRFAIPALSSGSTHTIVSEVDWDLIGGHSCSYTSIILDVDDLVAEVRENDNSAAVPITYNPIDGLDKQTIDLMNDVEVIPGQLEMFEGAPERTISEMIDLE